MQYDVIPARLQVPESVRFKYACMVCDDPGVTVAPKAADALTLHQVLQMDVPLDELMPWCVKPEYIGMPVSGLGRLRA